MFFSTGLCRGSRTTWLKFLPPEAARWLNKVVRLQSL
jgi:hypothetical protein